LQLAENSGFLQSQFYYIQVCLLFGQKQEASDFAGEFLILFHQCEKMNIFDDFALHFEPAFEPGAAATTFSDSVISGSSSAGIPITISPSSIPENFRDPSHPSEKFTCPFRYV